MSLPLSTGPRSNPTADTIRGWAAIAAPVLMLASTIAYITDGDGINDGQLGGVIGVWSSLAFVLAFAGIQRLLEPGARRAAPIVVSIATVGAAAGVGFNIEAMLAATFGRDAIDAIDDPIVILAYLPWGWCFPAGLIGMGIIGWRTRQIPRRAALLVGAAGILFVTARPARLDIPAVIGDVALVVGFVPLGWALLTGRATATRSSADASATTTQLVEP